MQCRCVGVALAVVEGCVWKIRQWDTLQKRRGEVGASNRRGRACRGIGSSKWSLLLRGNADDACVAAPQITPCHNLDAVGFRMQPRQHQGKLSESRLNYQMPGRELCRCLRLRFSKGLTSLGQPAAIAALKLGHGGGYGGIRAVDGVALRSAHGGGRDLGGHIHAAVRVTVAARDVEGHFCACLQADGAQLRGGARAGRWQREIPAELKASADGVIEAGSSSTL